MVGPDGIGHPQHHAVILVKFNKIGYFHSVIKGCKGKSAFTKWLIKYFLIMERMNIATGAPWEEKVGYSRAVRIGNIVEVSGTVALKDGQLVGKGDAYAQTKRILEIIEEVLGEAGAKMEDVVRTRMFVTDISQWEAIGKAHGEVFHDIRPATSMIEVSQLIDPGYLLEIEASAVVG